MTTPTKNAIARREPDDPYAVTGVIGQGEDIAAKNHYALTMPIGQILQSPEARAQIQALLPEGADFERVIIEVHRAATNNPDILKCTPASIINAVGTAVQTGLQIGREIHLVPVSGKLQAWNDYKGDITLVLWSGAARHVDAQAVYSGDTFEFELGDSPWVKHRPQIDPAKRGKLIAAYCIAWLNSMGTLKKIVVMPLADIEKIRKNSKSWNPDKVRDCPEWYAIKTTVHRNCKMLPKNRRLATVLAMLDSREQADQVSEELDPANRVDPLAEAPAITYPLRDRQLSDGEVHDQRASAPRVKSAEDDSARQQAAPEPTGAGDLFTEPQKSTPTIYELAGSINKLVKHPRISETQRKQFTERAASATSAEQLSEIMGEIETQIAGGEGPL